MRGNGLFSILLGTARHRTTLFAIFSFVFLFEAGFGYYYLHSEFKAKGMGGAFDPEAKGDDYLLLNPPFKFVFNDMAAYNKLAYSVIEQGGFYNPTGSPSAWVTPGFSLILVPIYLVFGYSFLPVLVLNGLCVTLAFLLLFLLSRDLFGGLTAWVVLLLLCVNLRVAYHVGNVLTEPVYLCLASASLLVFFQLIRQNPGGYGMYVLLGVLAGYSVLVRPVAVLFLLVAVAMLLMNGIRWPRVLLVVLLATLPLIAWIARNQMVFDRFVVSTNSVFAMAQGNNNGYKDISILDVYQIRNAEPSFIPTMKREAIGHGDVDTVYMERRTYVGEKAMSDWRKENLSLYARLCVWRFKALLSPYTQDMSSRNAVVSSVIWCMTFVPAAIAGFFLFKNRYYWMIVLLAVSLLILPSLVVVDMYLRYQLPSQLFLTIPAGYAFVEIARRSRLLRPGSK